METKTFFVVWTNSDTTEGRGQQYPFAICETKATALRLAKNVGVMGSDGDVLEYKAIKHEGRYVAPFRLERTMQEDLERQKQLDLKDAATAKAKAFGLTDAEIAALQQ